MARRNRKETMNEYIRRMFGEELDTTPPPNQSIFLQIEDLRAYFMAHGELPKDDELAERLYNAWVEENRIGPARELAELMQRYWLPLAGAGAENILGWVDAAPGRIKILAQVIETAYAEGDTIAVARAMMALAECGDWLAEWVANPVTKDAGKDD